MTFMETIGIALGILVLGVTIAMFLEFVHKT